ncbi:MAG: hypothetical protein RLZ75_1653, partial [Pseudomonadota bacterium]
MASVVFKHSVKIALAFLLASCASEPLPHQVQYSNDSKQQSIVSSLPLPVDKPIQQYPGIHARAPYSSSYEALMLTGTYANSPAVK